MDYLPGERLSLRGVRVGVPENYFFDRIDPTVVLKGLFPLPKLIRFVRERCPPKSLDEAALIDEWRQARVVASDLFRDEAGLAGN